MTQTVGVDEKRITVVLKWLGTALSISGVTLAAAGIDPEAAIMLTLNAFTWTVVGRFWREPAVWIPNGFAGIGSLGLLIGRVIM